MTETIIAGVDFSGSKTTQHETWLVIGKLGSLGLEIIDAKKMGAHALGQELAQHKALSTIGIDCPFSLPADFLQYLAKRKSKKDYQNWQNIVEELIFITYEEFVEIVKEYGKEPKRVTDTVDSTSALSPLHKKNPSMIEVSYYGMRLLASLAPMRFFVVPFQDPIPLGCSVLEVNTRDTLRYFGLPDTGYAAKEKQDEEPVKQRRHKTLHSLIEIREKKGITFKDVPRLTVPKALEHNFVNSEHALDALISCYTIGLYVGHKDLFDDPYSADQIEVLLEGWTFRPRITAKK